VDGRTPREAATHRLQRYRPSREITHVLTCGGQPAGTVPPKFDDDHERSNDASLPSLLLEAQSSQDFALCCLAV
jgi:hypothetical protein